MEIEPDFVVIAITMYERSGYKYGNIMWDLRFSQRWLRTMPSSVICLRVDLVRTDVSEDRFASIFREEKILE
jgi:hypothetical protein